MGTTKGRDPRVQGKGRTQGVNLREVLARHGVRPDKRFGQHFLVSEGVIAKIVDRVSDSLGILEVGPGPGVLTRPLSEFATVTAVELDTGILPVLNEVAPNARVLNQDALETDLAHLFAELPEPRALVSNMPYNITGPLLGKFAEVRHLYRRAVLMMQREVGDKVLAAPGDSQRGALSVVMQALFDIKRVCLVPPGAFLPPPKVDSVVLEFVPRHKTERYEDVFTVVRAGFTMPRKTLLNNLTGKFGRERAQSMIEGAGLGPTLRSHQLTWEQWKALAN